MSSRGRTRTYDSPVNSRTLCQLSYAGTRVVTMLGHRVASRITFADDGCWLWNGAVQSRGYGSVGDGGRTHLAHRWVYERLVGPIPDGLTIDHLCRVKRCVNPDHLEPVTAAVNLRRWADGITHCPRGHAYDDVNTYVNPRGERQCRACRPIHKGRRAA